MRAAEVRQVVASALVVGAVGLFLACGPRPHVGDARLADGAGEGGAEGLAPGTLAGTVMGVKGGLLAAYQLDGAQRGARVASGPVGEDGSFSVNVGVAHGAFLLAASGGSIEDLVTGQAGRVDGEGYSFVVDDFPQASSRGGVVLSPVSHLAASLALYRVRAERLGLSVALQGAWTHLNEHFGKVDWRLPASEKATSEPGSAQLDAAGKMALLNAAFSQLAFNISTRAGITPGLSVNVVSVSRALAEDLEADGYFDGAGVPGTLVLPPNGKVSLNGPSATELDGQSVRRVMADAAYDFLQSPKNVARVRIQDAAGVLNGLASNSNPSLFRTAGTAYDRFAPLLDLVSGVRWTNQNDYAFTVRAHDDAGGVAGAGVAAVYARLGAQTLKGELASEDTWVFRTRLPTPGQYSFSVWGVDRASNSGETEPFHVDVGLDQQAPDISLDAVPSYAPEDAIRLASPRVPAEYDLGGRQKVVVGPGATIIKAATRLSWGPVTPTAEMLRNQNPATLNIPFLRYAIAFNANVDAPIAAVEFEVSCRSGCGASSSPAKGVLLPDGSLAERYVLPFAVETVPWLTLAGGEPLELAITIRARDAAGNAVARTSERALLRVVGAPLWVEEDTAYPALADSRSTYAYQLKNGSYGQLFEPSSSAFAPDGLVRLVRYVVRNASPEPVALAPRFLGDARVLENWSATQWEQQGSSVVIGDAFCGGHGEGRGTFCSGPGCLPAGSPVVDRLIVRNELVAKAFRGPRADARELDEAPRTTDAAFYLVPAAQGATPGQLVVYASRVVTAVTAARDREYSGEERQIESEWTSCGIERVCHPVCIEYDYLGNCAQWGESCDNVYRDYADVTTWRAFRAQQSARTALSGSASFVTRGIRPGTTTPFGQEGAAAAKALDRSIAQ